jgi:ribokinase
VLNHAGTALAEAVLRRAGKAGVRTFFDSGDPSSRAPEVPELFGKVLRLQELDVLSCNENELAYFAQAAGDARSTGLEERARSVKREVRATLDVHTRHETLSLGADGRAAHIRAHTVEGRRATGAGDAWNAGNILGHLLGLPADERLQLANAVATCYVTAEQPLHPTLEDVAALLARAG